MTSLINKNTFSNTFKCIIALALLCIYIICEAQAPVFSTDSAKRKFYTATSIKDKLDVAMELANYYGGVENDIAQTWIYKAEELNQLNPNDTISYYLQIWQSEVFYYSGLYQFGIHSADKQIEKGYKVKDSFLIASGYFFKAINQLELDSLNLAKDNLTIALTLYPLHKPVVQYRKLAYHNQLVNVYAETLFKQKKYESALFINNKALKEAYIENSNRGIPAAHLVQGRIFMDVYNADSAIYHFNKTIEMANYFKHYDLLLLAYGKLSLINKKNQGLFNQYFKKGMKLIDSVPMNNSFKIFFYKDALTMAENFNDLKKIQLLQKSILAIKENDTKVGNELVQSITNQYVNNESKLLNLQIDDANQKRKLANGRLMLTLITLAFAIIAFLVYRYYQNQKLNVFKMRQKISQDLHDDIGSSLSSIQIFSELANTHWDSKPIETKNSVFKISVISKELMQQMSDIVWSMKPPTEEKNFFVVRIKNYASDLLTPMQINCTFNIDEFLVQKITNPHKRRSILLITKEAMNNIAKYSKAKNCFISFAKINGVLQLLIKDDGIGFNTNTTRMGNGLQNIENRCIQLGGNYILNAKPNNGVIITCNLPIAIFSHS
jgi:signal transduction histidine kinase